MTFMHSFEVFTGNVLGAFADRLSEQLDRAAVAVTGLRRESQAVLVTLLHEPSIGPTELARTLEITTPSVVHLLNRLEASGHLRRQPGRDGRRTTIELTAVGRDAVSAILAARGEVLMAMVGEVEPQHRAALHAALVSMVRSMTDSRRTGDHICRRCDESVCPDDACPVESALTESASAADSDPDPRVAAQSQT